MITLTCTKCQTVMEMDDAFAGGVCRCQHCGTIQTVPSSLKRNARPGSPAATAGGKQKALYSNTRGGGSTAVPSSGLDDLANAVASSGLSSGLANQSAAGSSSRGGRRSPTVDYARPGAAGRPGRLPLVVGTLVLVLAGAGGAAYFALRPAPAPPTVVPGGTGGPGVLGPAGPNDPSIAGPQFLGLPLDYKKVVFVVDRGQAGAESFDGLKAKLYETIAALGPQREFEVLFWPARGSADADEYAYPKGDTARGTSDRVASLRKHLEDVATGGATDVGPAIREAMRRNPDAVVLTTAKADYQLDDAFTKAVADARGGKSTVVHTVDLNGDGSGRPRLEAVAKAAGGKYVHVPPAKLR